MSKPVNAVFFTHDGDVDQGIFALRKFTECFADCDVDYVAPYTSRRTLAQYRKALPALPMRYVETESDLRSTFDALLEACGGADWALWLTSDRYPICRLPDPVLPRAIDLAQTGALDGYSAVKLTRWRDCDAPGGKDVAIPELAGSFEIRDYSTHGFWHPQLIRVSLLREMLDRFAEGDHPSDLNPIVAAELSSRREICLYPKQSIIKVEEPIVAGKLTMNYEARRLREGYSASKSNQLAPFTASFNAPQIQRVNGYWKSLSGPAFKSSRKWNAKTAFEVVSFGGVGSKALVKGLRAAAERPAEPDGSAGHTHFRIPPPQLPYGQRVIYVFSDPRNSVVSFFMRRLRRHQGHGFSGNAQDIPAPDWVLKHMSNIQADPRPMTEEWDLEDYLQQSNDLFRLEEHFDNWIYAAAPYPVTFLRYEALWKRSDQIAAHLGLENLPMPPQIERTADWRHLGMDQRAKLDRLYGDFARRLDALPDAFVSVGNAKFELDNARPVVLTYI